MSTATTWDRDGAVAAMFGRTREMAEYKARTCPAMPPDELESAAMLGLTEAANSFEPGRGVKFETHAECRIRGSMKDAQRRERPRGYQSRKPGGARIAVVPFSAAGKSDENSVRDFGPLNSAESPDPPPFAALETEEVMAAAMRGLDDGERAVVVALYRDGQTLKEAGRRVGRSETWASQTHSQLLDRLRASRSVRDRLSGEPVPDPPPLLMPPAPVQAPPAPRPARPRKSRAATPRTRHVATGMLSVGEVAAACGVTLPTVRKWADSGKLPCWRIPGSKHRRIRRADLTAFLAARDSA